MPDAERDYSPENQALLAGNVGGALARLFEEVEFEVDTDGAYTGRTIVWSPSGPWAVSVAPAPEIRRRKDD